MNGHRIARLRAANAGRGRRCGDRAAPTRASASSTHASASPDEPGVTGPGSDRNRVIQLLLKPISAAENASRRGALTP
jgi:hypothetical protein